MSRLGLPRPLARETLCAYRRTDYSIGVGARRRILRIGTVAPPGVIRAVFITACNPFGRRLPAAANRRALARLMTWLRLHGYHWQRGVGKGQGRTGRTWPAEPSVLVPGVVADLAVRWCVRWRQNAVVHVADDGMVSLVLHPSLRPRRPAQLQSASSSFRSAPGSAAARQPARISSASRLP